MLILALNLLGLLLIALIIWWFWFPHTKNERHVEKGLVEIAVESGIYTPAIIHTTVDKPLVLRFLRKDPSPCAEKVVFPSWDITLDLPLEQPKDLSLTPHKVGEYEFTCQMSMYRGKIIVEARAC